MVDTIHQVLFQHYRHKAYQTGWEFKQKYSILCRNIPTNEIKIYAAKGLLNAIKTYNPNYSFSKHMNLYIKNQLYIGLSDLQPLTPLPKSFRLSKKWKNENSKIYKKLTNTILVGDDYYLYDTIKRKQINSSVTHLENISKYQPLMEIRGIINNLDIEYQQIMNYKYNFYMQKIRNNSHVAQLMCCSEESIRKKLLIIQNIIQKECKKL
jgi:hypothetical protein